MNVEEKYRETYKEMKELIASRTENNAFSALGYTSNLDILCDFR